MAIAASAGNPVPVNNSKTAQKKPQTPLDIFKTIKAINHPEPDAALAKRVQVRLPGLLI